MLFNLRLITSLFGPIASYMRFKPQLLGLDSHAHTSLTISIRFSRFPDIIVPTV